MLDYGVLRIPGSRPFRISPKKEKEVREQSWDNRFHLGRIPDYNAFHDKYLNPNVITNRKKKIIIGVGRIRKKKEVSSKDLLKSTSSKTFQKPPVMKNQILKKLKDNLTAIYNQKAIPEAQREVFFEALSKLQPKKQSSAIVKEIELLKNDKNLIQFAIRAIVAREYSIRELKEFAKSINLPTSTLKHNSVESILNLRMLSIHVVECIQAWKRGIQEVDPGLSLETIKFVWENENYFVKMQNDTLFLKYTPIASFIEFSENDPFFIRTKAENGKIELPVPNYLFKRIKESELALQQEGMKSEEPAKEKENFVQSINQIKSQENNTESKVNNEENNIQSVPQVKIEENYIQMEKYEIEFEEVTENIETEINKYSSEVPAFIQESMGKISNVYASSLTMKYPAFLWAKMNKKTVGLVSLNLENQKSMQKRMQISHISAISAEILDLLSGKAVKFIWENYPNCIEIRVGIISKVNSQGKYEADKSIKQCFDKLGFRWKQMIYAINEIPIQLLGLRRPDSLETRSVENSVFDDCIQISYGCVLQFSSDPQPIKANKYCSEIGMVCALMPLGKNSHTEFGKVQQKMNAIPPAFRYRKDNTSEAAVNDLKKINLQVDEIPNSETVFSCSALGLSWSHFFPAIFKNIHYTRILTQVEVMKSSDFTVFIIATEDPQYNAFIIPYSEEITDNPFTTAKEILAGIEKDRIAAEIWVPNFEISDHYDNSDIVGTFCNDLSIGLCKEIFKFKLFSATHPLGSLIQVPTNEDIVVSDSFFFGMIHQKIDEQYELPLFVVQVLPQNFISTTSDNNNL